MSQHVPRKWLKFKCENQQEFIIIGYTKPQGERIGFGAILVGYYEHKKLRYAGKVGTGFNDDMLKNLSKHFIQLEVDHCPLASEENVDSNNIHWLKPKLVVEISFLEWTKNWKLRHPSFKGIRKDKKATKVVSEEKRRKQH